VKIIYFCKRIKNQLKMNINVNNLKLFLIFALISCLFSCEYHTEEDIIAIEISNEDDGNGNNEGTPGAAATFSANVKPIIDSRCVSCHNGSRFPDLRTYDGIKNSAAIVKSEVSSRSMPQGSSLTNAQIQAIVSWVDDGAQNN
jgi:uncharacterized membrane protein